MGREPEEAAQSEAATPGGLSAMSEPPLGAADDEDPHTEKLSDIMKRAEAGDVLAALEVAQDLALMLSPAMTQPDWNSGNPAKRIPMPVPD